MTEQSGEAPKGRVILTYGRSLMSLAAAQVLDDHDVEVIGCDSIDLTVVQNSRHCSDYFVHRDLDKDPDGFIEDLLEAVREFEPEDDRPYVLMPVFRETRLVAAHAEKFEGLIKVAAPDWTSISGVEPKDQLIGTAEEAGVRAPIAKAPRRDDNFDALFADFPVPALTKPAEGVGGRGIERHESRDDLLNHLRDLPDDEPLPVVQEFVEGEDFCFCALCDDGEVVAHMVYRNLQSYPKGTGAGVLRETVDDSPFLDDARKLLKHLNWNGVCEIDYRWTGKAEEKPCLIEVNARFWAGLFHSIASGLEYPWYWYQLAAFGKCDEPREATVGRKSKVPVFWFLAAAQDAAANEDYPKRLQEAWDSLTHGDDTDASTLDRFTGLVKSLFDAPALAHLVKSVMDAHKQGDDAAADFIPPEDPRAAVGALFVASSLIRHGKLPPELKSG